MEQKARKACRHKIVYTDIADVLVVVRALQGRSTASIAREFHMTESKVNYRIYKAQQEMDTSFRGDYRNGLGIVARKMAKATTDVALGYVRNEIAPKFIPLAAAGVSRKTI